jgi:hypothetical protein
MKFITLVLMLLLVVSCAHVDTTSPSVNIDGTWKGVWDSKGKTGQLPKLFIIKFKSDGGILTGTGCDATTNPDKWYDLQKVKRKGNKLYFSGEPMPGLTFRFEGKIDGDIMNVTFRWDTPGGEASDSFILERE